MTSLLFDTDVLIEILRGNKKVVAEVRHLTESAHLLSCSCITVGEIFAGMKAHEEKATRKLLNGLIKIPVTEKIAELAGTLKSKTRSHALYLDDCIIAATALSNGITLVTKNIKHYPFKELSVIKVR